MDRQTIIELDREIAHMPADQQLELTRQGNRIIKGTGTEDAKAKGREYMRKYKARIALAHQRGILK